MERKMQIFYWHWTIYLLLIGICAIIIIPLLFPKFRERWMKLGRENKKKGVPRNFYAGNYPGFHIHHDNHLHFNRGYHQISGIHQIEKSGSQFCGNSHTTFA